MEGTVAIGAIAVVIVIGVLGAHALYALREKKYMSPQNRLNRALRYTVKLLGAGWFYVTGMALGELNPYLVLVGLVINTFAVSEYRASGRPLQEEETRSRSKFPLNEFGYLFSIGTMIQYAYNGTDIVTETLVLATLLSIVVFYEQQDGKGQSGKKR